jgi:PKD repeat protein
VSFSGQGSDSDGYIVGYSWQSSIDGVLNSKSSFSTNQLSVGTHSISFKVEDNNGEWSIPVTTSITITVDEDDDTNGPVADGGDSLTGTVNVPVVFDASGSYDPEGGSIESYKWEFGDGSLGSGVIITHSYNTSGNYSVKLTVTDSEGDTGTCSLVAFITQGLDDDNGSQDGNESSVDSTPGFLLYLFICSLIISIIQRKKQRK